MEVRHVVAIPSWAYGAYIVRFLRIGNGKGNWTHRVEVTCGGEMISDKGFLSRDEVPNKAKAIEILQRYVPTY